MEKMDGRRVFFLSTGLVFFLVFVLWTVGKGQTQKVELPRTLFLATNPTGSLNNSLGAGLSIVLSKHLPTVVKVIPTTGAAEWLPMITTGEIAVGVISTYDAQIGRLGKQEYKAATAGKGAPIQLLCCGIANLGGMIVAGDSGIKKGSELKGRKVVSLYTGSGAITAQCRAYIANFGLKGTDFKELAVPGVQEGVRAIIEGRADASVIALGASVISELNAAKGARFLSLDPSPEAVKRLVGNHPGYLVQVSPQPAMIGIKEPTYMHAFDFYLVGYEKLGNDVAYSVVKTLWEYNKELAPIHPRLKDWTKERFVSNKATIPYHPGSIKFYKEMGVWGAEMDNLQRQLLEMK